MTREDIHEAAKHDDQDGVKPGAAAEPSEGGSGLTANAETAVNGADAVPQKTSGSNDPSLEQPS